MPNHVKFIPASATAHIGHPPVGLCTDESFCLAQSSDHQISEFMSTDTA